MHTEPRAARLFLLASRSPRPPGDRCSYSAVSPLGRMKRYYQLVRLFLGAGVLYGVFIGLVKAFASNWIVGVLAGVFSGAMICLGVPFFLLMLEHASRGPTKLQFRIRTMLAFSGVITLALASWQWTNTYGVQRLAKHYETNAREVVRGQISKYSLRKTDDEILDGIDYFVNPHTDLPFIITVETDDAFKTHYSVKSSARSKNTHVWFFGYVSDPISKHKLFLIFVQICVLALVALILCLLILWINVSRRKMLAAADSDHT